MSNLPAPRLSDLLEALENADQLFADEFNPEQLLGDVRDKVDGIKFVLDRLEGFKQFLKLKIEPLQNAVKTADNNAAALKEYVRYQMESHSFERLPGDLWRVQLQRNGKAALEIDREPTYQDFEERPELVEMVRFYKWKKDKIEEHLENGGQLSFARLKRGTHIRFYVNSKKLIPSTKSGSKWTLEQLK